MSPDGASATGGVSGPFIRRPVATWLAMSAILLAGLAAFFRLPVAPLPQIDFPTIQVQASLPGASPATMAATVAQPLERQFAQIPGLNELTSVSAVGATTITAEFALDRDIDAAAQDGETSAKGSATTAKKKAEKKADDEAPAEAAATEAPAEAAAESEAPAEAPADSETAEA